MGLLSWFNKQWDDIKGNVKFALLLFALSGAMGTVIALIHGLQVWQQVILGLLFIWMFAWGAAMTWKVRASNNVRTEQFSNLAMVQIPESDLELRFGQHSPYKAETTSYTVYRLGVLNKNANRSIENVAMYLLDIIPRPRAALFRPDFPCLIQAPSALGDAIPKLNPLLEVQFDFIRFWMSANQELMLGGWKHGSFPMERDELWRLKIRVSSANAGSKEITIAVQVQGNSVYAFEDKNSTPA